MIGFQPKAEENVVPGLGETFRLDFALGRRRCSWRSSR